ncbi:YCF48-related protein [Lutibacter sp.]|uniref:WD40/YVTN/BNR-like repeat-containing protein n=1 Tax=Lutibacter sp. TaxID=1925666 RepID=UPI0025C0B2D3|nr:YCF48-related protein [Lutibacter sp.]MCF6180593.1 YCF48-related protein [Lutibacter sp.]
MKRVLYLIIIISVFGCSNDEPLNDLNLWNELNTPTPQTLVDIQFIDENFGITCGALKTLMKTEDGGENWIKLNVDVSASFNSVFILNNNNFYTSRVGLYQTLNSGNTFNEVGNLSNYFGTIFDIHFFNIQNGVIVKGGQVLKTNDGGLNWVSVLQGHSNKLVVTSNETLYLAGGSTYDNVHFGELYKSTNNGGTWNELNLPSTIQNSEIVAINFIDNNNGFIVNFNREIYKTSDGGLNWILVSSGGNFTDLIMSILFLNENDGYVLSGNSIYRTNDGGLNWSKEYEHEDIDNYLISMTSTPNGKLYVVGENGIILKRNK